MFTNKNIWIYINKKYNTMYSTRPTLVHPQAQGPIPLTVQARLHPSPANPVPRPESPGRQRSSLQWRNDGPRAHDLFSYFDSVQLASTAWTCFSAVSRFGKSPFYLPKLSSKFSFPPWTRKPDKPRSSIFKTIHFTSLTLFIGGFQRRFCLFLFSLFWLNIWKIIVNYRKIIKWKI
jgi:hypothetical protein